MKLAMPMRHVLSRMRNFIDGSVSIVSSTIAAFDDEDDKIVFLFSKSTDGSVLVSNQKIMSSDTSCRGH
jgi:hypothetical protein